MKKTVRIGTAVPMDRDEIDPEVLLVHAAHELAHPRRVGMDTGWTAEAQTCAHEHRPFFQRSLDGEIRLVLAVRFVEAEQRGEGAAVVIFLQALEERVLFRP